MMHARTERLSLLLAEQAARTFEALNFTLRGFEPLLESSPANAGDQEIEALLRRRVQELSFVRDISIFTQDGQLRLSSSAANDHERLDRDLAVRLLADPT